MGTRVGLFESDAAQPRALHVALGCGESARIEVRTMELAIGAEPSAFDQLYTATREGIPDHVCFADRAGARQGGGQRGMRRSRDVAHSIVEAQIGRGYRLEQQAGRRQLLDLDTPWR